MGPGDTYDWRREKNSEIFEQLTRGPWDVTVRTIGPPEVNGIRGDAPGVKYVQGAMAISTAEIDIADVVIAGTGTFSNVAVARGAPTIFYAQFEALYGLAGEEQVPLARRSLYEDITRYPFDVEDGDLEEVIHAAAQDYSSVETWRKLWIGQPFEPKSAVVAIEEFVTDLIPQSVIA
jgi:hypothetical protein